MHVQYWSWLLLCVLGNAETIRRSIHCSVGPRFDVHCTRANPCHNLDIFCPSGFNTEMLLVDCNGPHACSDVNIYSSVSSTVRCRGRSSACDNINYYCGDMTSVLAGSLFDDSTDRSISCKFEHLTAYGTVNSFFGCYGDVKECISTAVTDYAFTDNRMYCETDNTPCVIDCETSASCMNDILECTTENSHLCQCKNNCASVKIGPPEALSATNDPQTSSTVSDELQAEAKEPTTTAVAQKTTNKETVTTTAASNSALTTSTSGSTMQEKPATTEKPSTVTTETIDEESTEQPSIVTTQTNDKETTEQPSTDTGKPSTIDEATTEKPSTDTTQTPDEESTTKSSISSTSQPITTVNMMTTKISSVTNATGQPAADYQDKSTGHVLKAWQLALLIVLPTIAVAIGCFIVAYAIQRWRKGDETIQGRLHDEENQLGIYAPLKKIQIGAPTIIETESTMTQETHHTKCASAQSIDLVLVSPDIAALNTTTTTTTAIEGDGH